MATSERRLADNVWDLRDDAHDHPERWAGVTVEAVLRRLAAFVEEAEKRGEPIDWWQDVTERMIDWRGAEG